MRKKSFVLFFALSVASCASQQFASVPPDLDRQHAPKQSIDVKAERYKFIPDVIHVQEGTLVTLKITSTEGTHGFQLGAFGIDERLDENVTKVIEFYASKKGEYGFRCSHVCGIGHLGMTGKILVQ